MFDNDAKICRSRMLVLGPRYHSMSTHIGGIVVSFEMLLKKLEERGIECIVVDTNKANYENRVFAILSIYRQVLINIRVVDHVSLHGTAKDFVVIAPFVVFLSRISGLSVSLRKFAGSFWDIYDSSGRLTKLLVRLALVNSSVNFFQTKKLVDYFHGFNSHTYWLPNSRSRPNNVRLSNSYRRRFVFLGLVRREKGIVELIRAANELGSEFEVDIYGSIFDLSLKDEITNSKANYKGVLHPGDVSKTLATYDVLVLPTFWSGEGYPGVIIEAFSVGLPVVTTMAGGIGEIVEHGANGLLVEPQNSSSLIQAMKIFSSQNYSTFSLNALQSFDKFDSNAVTDNFLRQIGTQGFAERPYT